MSMPRIGIRAKIAITLTLVAFLPLLIMLILTITRWSDTRRELAGQGLLSLGMAEGRGLSVSLVKDIQTYQMDLQLEPVRAQVAEANERPRLSQEKLDEYDRRWPTAPLDWPPMYQVLHHPLVTMLRQIETTDGRILQSFITDQAGQLVAATGRTDDFYQADESWWTDAYNNGSGKVVVLPVEYDPAVKAHVLQICVPIFGDQKVIGVAKFKVDLARWLQSVSVPPTELNVQLMLVRGDGLIVYRQGMTGGKQMVSGPLGDLIHNRRAMWTISGEEVQACVPLAIESRIGGIQVQMSEMFLVTYVPQREAMASIYRTVVLLLATGLLVILMIFLGGIIMVERLIVRRVRALEQAARTVAGGDLSARVPSSEHWLTSEDEIDELERDFNEMASHIERTHNELTAVSELKSNFIKVASHELRTPVSYILGVIKLLRGNRDAERLSQAISSIAGRAKRLDDIIHAMFKLLPDQLADQTLRYEDVSLPELMEEIYVDCFPFIEQRDQKLLIDCPAGLPILRADRDKLRDVVENLVINAIKFTPNAGQVSVRVRSELNHMISIAVTDQGSGIPQKELPYLFQPFYSGGDVLQHSTGDVGYQKRGMGLGLAVVRHFVELHQGTVNLSTGPHGSTFTVLLPIHRMPASEAHDFAI
jgi:signal transduction histidine kinase